MGEKGKGNVEPGTELKGRLQCTVGASSINYIGQKGIHDFIGLLGQSLIYSLYCLFSISSLNPFLSCWKIGKMRQAEKNIFMHIFCSSS